MSDNNKDFLQQEKPKKPRPKKKRRKKRKRAAKNISAIITMLVSFIIIIIGVFVTLKKYAPTKETMALTDYYILTEQDEAAVILNGKYDPDAKREVPEAITVSQTPYISLSYLKSNLDDGYVYDKDEHILRYVTDKEVISAALGDISYTKGRDSVSFNAEIISEKGYGTYINLNFVSLFTDISYTFNPSPSRVSIETAGSEKTMATLTKNTQLRRFGGPKSKILKEALKGDSLQVLEDYGKWSNVLSGDGVIGCVQNKYISKLETVTYEARLPERVYTHNLLDKKINLVWDQVANSNSLNDLKSELEGTSGINVVSPTWYKINDNEGNVHNISSQAYVNYCRENGIEVWPLFTNFDIEGVDSTQILNHTSSRDNLVNSVIAAAISDNVDGIVVDFESLSIEAKDGFIEFVREISLKCKANDLILSVVNYKPESHTLFYNRKEQAKYADYIIFTAYDEHHGNSETAGSNSSLPFVREGVLDTLTEVPKEQLIVGLPFYTRVWCTDSSGNLTQRAMGISASLKQVEKSGAEKVWLPTEEQYYVKYSEEGNTYEMWLEDEESLSRKFGVVKDNDLAGVAFWRLGIEQKSIWDVLAGYLN